jgi:hypothetical protein
LSRPGITAQAIPPCPAANEPSVKDPAKHEAGFKQAIERNPRRETGRKFMFECMTK